LAFETNKSQRKPAQQLNTIFCLFVETWFDRQMKKDNLEMNVANDLIGLVIESIIVIIIFHIIFCALSILLSFVVH